MIRKKQAEVKQNQRILDSWSSGWAEISACLSVTVYFTCDLGRAWGCLVSTLSLTSRLRCKVFPEELTFQLAAWAKQMAFPRVGGHHPSTNKHTHTNSVSPVMKGNFKSQLLHVMANTILNHKIQSLQVYGWALSYTRRKKEMKNLHPTTATSPLLLLLLLLSRFSRVQLCVTPEMAAHQAPPSLGFSLIPRKRGKCK